MRVELDLEPVAQFLADVPTWGWVGAGIHAWYALAGVVVRHIDREEREKRKEKPCPEDEWLVFLIWMISPLIATVFIAMILGSTLAWASSMGAVSPPWRWFPSPKSAPVKPERV